MLEERYYLNAVSLQKMSSIEPDQFPTHVKIYIYNYKEIQLSK